MPPVAAGSAAQREIRVAAQGLTKAYGDLQAVADVSFTIASGEVLGLLGPNGAGKTSTIEVCAGLLSPDAGTVAICGLDMRTQASGARQCLGVALQSTGFQDGITPLEALRSFGAFYRRSIGAPELLQRFALTAKATTRVALLSAGERQRLALALAFVNDPAVVFLDEPTAQLDPLMRHEFHAYIRQMKQEGRALLLATHDMEEASELCDRLIVLSAGHVVASGTPRDLGADVTARLRVQAQTSSPLMPQWLAACEAIEGAAVDGSGLQFTTSDLNQALAQLALTCSAHGVRITDLRAGRGRLAELILKLSDAESRGQDP